MKTTKRQKKKSSIAFPVAFAAAGLVLVGAGAWYLWFHGASDVTEDQLRELQAFEEYDRQRSA